MRLIDADAFVEKIKQHAKGHLFTFDGVIRWIENAPTVDAVPVVHGRLEEFDTQRRIQNEQSKEADDE